MIKSAVPMIPRRALISLEQLAAEAVPLERAIRHVRLARNIAEVAMDTKNLIPSSLLEIPSPPEAERKPEILTGIPSPKPRRRVKRKVAGFKIPGPLVLRLERDLGRFAKALPRSGKVDQALIGANAARLGYEGLPEPSKEKSAAPINRLLKVLPKPSRLASHYTDVSIARQGVNAVLPGDEKIPAVPDILSSKLSEYRARVQLQKFAGIASPKPYAIWLMQKQAFIGALLGGVARFGARFAPRLIARPMLSAAMRVAPRFATQRLMPQILRGAAGRAVARHGGQMAPVLSKVLPKGVTLGGPPGILAPEALERASYLARGAGRAAAGAEQTAVTAARTAAPKVSYQPGAFNAGFVPGAPAAAKAPTTAAGQAASQTGQQAAEAGKASFMDIAKNYFKPETWTKGWEAPGAKFNTALTFGMGVMSGQNPAEAGFSAAAAIPFARAGFIPSMVAGLGAGMLGSKLFGSQQPAAAPPPPAAEAPAPQMPEPMPMLGGYSPPPPPMFQPGFRG